MFKKNVVANIFPDLCKIYNISEVILIGSDVPSWLEMTEKSSIDRVCYVNQACIQYAFDNLPSSWSVIPSLLAKDNGSAVFYELSNSYYNGTTPGDELSCLWENIVTLSKIKKPAVSLSSLLSENCVDNPNKAIVVDSFDGLRILQDLKRLQVSVVIVKIVDDRMMAFDVVSKTNMQNFMVNIGYKCINTYEDNHPMIKTAVYVLDCQQQSKALQDNISKEREAKERLQVELDNFKVEVGSQSKALQDNISKEREAKERLHKDMVHIKQEFKYRCVKVEEELLKYDSQLKLLKEITLKEI